MTRIVTFALSIFLLAACVWGALHYQARLPDDEALHDLRWLVAWSVKGLALPILAWIILNSGWLPRLPTLLPAIEFARSSGGPWAPVWLNYTSRAILAISTHWLALTLLWFGGALLVRREDRVDLLIFGLCWALLLLPFVAVVVFLAGWWGSGVIVVAWSLPMLHVLLSDIRAEKLPPSYARAVAKMKFGRYRDAEWEVIQELEKAEDDFDGWMMLAELYANHFHDLPAAAQTVHELCAQPATTASQVAVALHRLADWHLAATGDLDAARRALEEIPRRFPETHLARMAQLRINQLPPNRDELQRGRNRTVRLPALSDVADASAKPAGSSASREQAEARALDLEAKLGRDANDTAAREELARLLAEPLQQVDRALEQIALLRALPEQPDNRRAEWLGLAADWQLRLRHDRDAARTALSDLIHEHPHSPQAFAAQRRLNLMRMEDKLNLARHTQPGPAPATNGSAAS